MKPMVIVALNTGMRKGEIFNLKWNDTDFRKRIIYVLVTKNNEVRKIPMNDITFKTLLRVRKNPRSPYVFCKNNGDEEDFAGVVELADTLDSKSSEAYPSCGFKSHLRHQTGISYCVYRMS